MSRIWNTVLGLIIGLVLLTLAVISSHVNPADACAMTFTEGACLDTSQVDDLRP